MGGGQMAVATGRIGGEPNGVILQLLDRQGIVKLERHLPFPADTRVDKVRLFPGSRGIWLSVRVADPGRTGKTHFGAFGDPRMCNAYLSQLRLLNESFVDANDFRQIPDIE